jgi:hypothetical protein
MTDGGPYAPRLEQLEGAVADLAKVGQGLIVHEHLAALYGVELTDDDRSTVHVRRVEGILDRIVARYDRPLDEPRPVADRVAGNCRHYTVLMVSILRAHAVPARARCGFGAYFPGDAFEDHWVCEYWDEVEDRWKLVDAQIDLPQRQYLGLEFDLTDVPRDEFLIAGDAWQQCRAGEKDPDRFGLSMIPEFGLWWVAQNTLRDAAALGNVEMLPWDVWGAMPAPDDEITEEQYALFDELSVLTLDPDARWDELQSLMQDDRLRVPSKVFNAGLQREEPV